MKKALKIVSLIIAIVLTLSMFTINVFAARTTLIFSNSNPQVGETVTVTLKISADANMNGVTGFLSYNPNVLKFSSSDDAYESSSGVVEIQGQAKSTSAQYSVSFTVVSNGDSTISAYGLEYVPDGDDVNAQLVSLTGASGKITVAQATNSTPSTPSTPSNDTPSNNASLSSLKVSGATLSPSFKASTTKYTAKVSNTTEKVSISGNAVDGGTCEGLGTFNLSVGDNVRYITVTAADGKTKKTYSVNIIRAAEGEDVPEENAQPLSVLINEAAHTVVQQAPETAPAGFELSTATYNGQEVSVLKSADGKIVLYTIANDETQETNYYTYDESTNQFSLLKYAVLNGKMFIFAENEKSGSAEGYEKTELTIGNATIEAYKSTDPKLSDFYIFYSFVEGTYGYYSFDSLEGTIQRAPAFKLVEAEKTEEDKKEVISSLNDLAKLDARGKAVIIVLLVIVLCVIALIVLVIIRFVKLRKLEEEDYLFFDENDAVFDQVNVEDNSENNNDTI